MTRRTERMREDTRKRDAEAARAYAERIARLGKPLTIDRTSPRELYYEVRRLYLTPFPDQPRERAECANVERPCPHTACRWNNYVDEGTVDAYSGLRSIKLNYPKIEPHEVPPHCSCALDLAEDGGSSSELVADALNITRQAVELAETRALAKLRDALESGSVRRPRLCEDDR